MKKKYGFTLVEMFAVVIILGILAGVGIWRLSTRNADRYKAEMCVNQYYSELSKFIHAATTNKIFTAEEVIQSRDDLEKNEEIIPKNYFIQETWGADLILGINGGYNDIRLKHLTISTIQNCINNNKYEIQITSKYSKNTNPPIYEIPNDRNTYIELKPGLVSKGNTPGIKIGDGHNLRTLFFDLREGNSSEEEFAKITLDRRSGILRKSFCQLYNTDDNPTTTDIDERKTCAQRSL